MSINSSNDAQDVARDLKLYMLIVAGISTIIASAVIVTFRSEEPVHPPDYFEALKRDLTIHSHRNSIMKSFKTLITNKNFICLTLGYGLQLGIFNGFSTLINSIILYYFPVCRRQMLRLFKYLNFIRTGRSIGSRVNLLRHLGA